MEQVSELCEEMYRDLLRHMKMNLREALQIIELHTIPQGHPDYRFICQEMWRKIQEVHPALAKCGKFIDSKKYRLGRLQSEMRTEFKRSGFEK
jgi:thymidylate synthase ThyX